VNCTACRWKWCLNVWSWQQTTLPSGVAIRAKEKPSHGGLVCITSDGSRNWYEQCRFLKPEEPPRTSFPARQRSCLRCTSYCIGDSFETVISSAALIEFSLFYTNLWIIEENIGVWNITLRNCTWKPRRQAQKEPSKFAFQWSSFQKL
jgi:hypothetical protein